MFKKITSYFKNRRERKAMKQIFKAIKNGETPSLIGRYLTQEQLDELDPYVKNRIYFDSMLKIRVPFQR